MTHPISKWPTRPLSRSLYPGYKGGLRTPVQHRFSLELACCSNSVSHSSKLYSLLILPHVWKFFCKPHTDYDSLQLISYHISPITTPSLTGFSSISLASKAPFCCRTFVPVVPSGWNAFCAPSTLFYSDTSFRSQLGYNFITGSSPWTSRVGQWPSPFFTLKFLFKKKFIF